LLNHKVWIIEVSPPDTCSMSEVNRQKFSFICNCCWFSSQFK